MNITIMLHQRNRSVLKKYNFKLISVLGTMRIELVYFYIIVNFKEQT